MEKNIINTFIKRLSISFILIFCIFLIIEVKFSKNNSQAITDKVTINSILGENYNVETVLYGALQQSSFFQEHKIKKTGPGVFTLIINSKNIQESNDKLSLLKIEIEIIENIVHSVLRNYNDLQLLSEENYSGINIGYFIINNNRNFLFTKSERGQIRKETLINKIVKYSYLFLLSILVSLFILYIFKMCNKKSINNILKKFT